MQNRANQQNKLQVQQAQNSKSMQIDKDRGLKKVIGTIHELDPTNQNKLTCTVWISTEDGARRLWGNGNKIVITDSPLDILQRFGLLAPGMIIEVFWRGIEESGLAQGHIIGEPQDIEIGLQGGEIPTREVNTASSIPFEPLGL